MSPKPLKQLFDTTGAADTNGIREFSAAGFIFAYVQKYFLALVALKYDIWWQQFDDFPEIVTTREMTTKIQKTFLVRGRGPIS